MIWITCTRSGRQKHKNNTKTVISPKTSCGDMDIFPELSTERSESTSDKYFAGQHILCYLPCFFIIYQEFTIFRLNICIWHWLECEMGLSQHKPECGLRHEC